MNNLSGLQFILLTFVTLHFALGLPFKNGKPAEPDAGDRRDDDLLGDPMMDKAEDQDEKKKVHESDDDQGVPVIGGGDGDDDNANDGDGDDHDLKFVKIPDGVKKLPVEKLRPVDHMDAVKMEQDGHINKDFHKEMFLGNHEEFENDHYEEAESKLKDIVYKYVLFTVSWTSESTLISHSSGKRYIWSKHFSHKKFCMLYGNKKWEQVSLGWT